jgi:small-conductance mechanosensitive channel
MEAFRKAGISIPYPQRDLHLKDIDRLEAALTGKETPAKKTRASRKRQTRSKTAKKSSAP